MDAKQWNERYAIGQSVYLTEDDGSITTTQTRSIAWSLGAEVFLIKVDGRAGGYLLGRIKPR